MDQLYLALGCFGQRDDNFISCPGIQNSILDLSTRLDQYNQMMDYFENCRLFDRPIFEYSTIIHFIKNMQDKFDQISVGKKLWTEKHYHLFQKFISDHRQCGLYIKLLLNKPEQKAQEKSEEKILITAVQPKIRNNPKINIKLLKDKYK